MSTATLAPAVSRTPGAPGLAPPVRPPGGPNTGTWPYFGRRHPLARLARERCRTHHAPGRRVQRVGEVACGACWEHAIRADERFVAECGLDGAPEVPADDVDEIAVAQAVAGRRVPLNDAERAVAVRLLAGRGMPACRIADRLHVNVRAVRDTLTAPPVPPVRKEAPPCPRTRV